MTVYVALWAHIYSSTVENIVCLKSVQYNIRVTVRLYKLRVPDQYITQYILVQRLTDGVKLILLILT